MDLVEDVNAPKIGLVTEAPVWGDLDGLRGVFAGCEDGRARDGDRSSVAEMGPGEVDFVAWFLAEDAKGLGVEESCVHGFGGDGYVDFV